MSVFTLTFAQAESRYLDGLLSDRDWRRYQIAWAWSAHRIGGVAGQLQHAFWCQYGDAAYVARINRIRRVLGLSLYTPWNAGSAVR